MALLEHWTITLDGEPQPMGGLRKGMSQYSSYKLVWYGLGNLNFDKTPDGHALTAVVWYALGTTRRA